MREDIISFINYKIIRNKSNKKLETLWGNLLKFIEGHKKKTLMKWEIRSVTKDEDSTC